MNKDISALPAVFRPGGTDTPFLKKYKQTRLDKWSLTRWKSINEMFDFAAFLWAVGRDTEAIDVCEFPMMNVPGKLCDEDCHFRLGVYACACIRHQIMRMSGRREESLVWLSAMGFVEMRPELDESSINAIIRESEQWIGLADDPRFTPTIQRLFLVGAIRHSSTMLSDSDIGRPNTSWYPVAHLTTILESAKDKLAVHLMHEPTRPKTAKLPYAHQPAL